MIASFAVATAVVSLSVAPARLSMAPGTTETVQVTNTGKAGIVVGASTAGYALDLRGRARIVQSGTSALWLSLRPGRLVLAPGGTASLTVAAHRPAGARPGDHDALVLLTTLPHAAGALSVRMRVGVVVAVRVPGRLVEQLVAIDLRRARPGVLELVLANRGNLVEQLPTPVLTISLWRGGRLLARLRPVARQLLPGARGVAEVHYPRGLRGAVTAVVEAGGRGRMFRLRL
jgi:hypothetical protein